MKPEQLISALQNVNINSDTAAQIAEQYFRYQYVELAVSSIGAGLFFAFFAFMGAVVWKITRDD